MLAKIFDKQESDGYEKKSTSSYKEKIVKPNDSTCYTLDPATFNPESMVRVLLLFNQILYFKNTKIPTSIGPLKAKISKVIVHFHGGAFVSQSAYSH
jgi:acetyl esterase/lipase